jgi:uncharacterized protein (UPF0305 family)
VGCDFDGGLHLHNISTISTDLWRACKVATDKLGEGIIKAMMYLMTGKVSQSTKDHSDVEVFTSEQQCMRNIAFHRFKDFTIITLKLFFMRNGTVRYKNHLLVGILHLYKSWDRFPSTFSQANQMY